MLCGNGPLAMTSPLFSLRSPLLLEKEKKKGGKKGKKRRKNKFFFKDSLLSGGSAVVINRHDEADVWFVHGYNDSRYHAKSRSGSIDVKTAFMHP